MYKPTWLWSISSAIEIIHFSLLSFGPPHNPYKALQKDTKLYGKDIPKRPNVPSKNKSFLEALGGFVSFLSH